MPPRHRFRADPGAGADGIAPRPESHAVLGVRLLLALAFVVAVSSDPSASRDGSLVFGLAVGLGWVPAAGVVHLWWRHRPTRWAPFLAAALDVSFFVGVAAVFGSEALPVALMGLLLPVSYYGYSHSRSVGLFAVVGAVVVGASASVLNPGGGASLELMRFGHPLIVLAAFGLAAGARREQSRARESLSHISDRVDAILTGVAESVVVTSPRGRIRTWNGSAAATLGCSDADAVGRSCGEILGLRKGLEALDCSQGCALVRAGAMAEDVQVWRVRPDGERQPLLARVAPVPTADGTVAEVVHSYRDVTRLVEADEAKTMFIATTSHELKTPLTVILGYSELMLRRPNLDAAEQRAGLLAIQSRARQLSEIVDRLLLTSRIEAGRVEIEAGPVDAVAVVEAQALAIQDATARRVEIRRPASVPPVLADERALATVIDHLLDNALKYSADEDPVTVEIAERSAFVTVAIADRGVGMTEDQASRCFERFWQADAGDVRRFGGTGIGLYIVASLVEAMHGVIAVDSEPGVGSRFTLSLPRADRAREREHDRSATGKGERTVVDEFMRQVGISAGRGDS